MTSKDFSPARPFGARLRGWICAAALALGGAWATPAQADERLDPNADWVDVEVGKSFVFRQPKQIKRVLISDDQGTEYLSAYGENLRVQRTPAMDQLASERSARTPVGGPLGSFVESTREPRRLRAEC